MKQMTRATAKKMTVLERYGIIDVKKKINSEVIIA